jgi:type I restriction enzyme R subunit
MKGQGTRTISETDLKAVTPDVDNKTHFVIVDAIGVCESDKTDSRPLERKRGVPFDKLIISIAMGNRDTDTLSSLAGRLARLDRQLDEKDKGEIEKAAGGVPLKKFVNSLLDAVDPDIQIEKAKETFQTEVPTEDQIQQAAKQLAGVACSPFDDATLRNKIIEIKKKNEQILDTISQDKVISTGYDEHAKENAQALVNRFREFIEDNKDEILALQIFYSKPYGHRYLTFAQIKELAEAINKPPYRLTPEILWQAYEQLHKSKVSKAGPQKLLTNIISLIRFAIGEVDKLETYSESIDRRFEDWLAEQERVGRSFTEEQLDWLYMIKDHIVSSLTIEMDDFGYAPFNARGGAAKVCQLFGSDLNQVIDELNEVLAA